MQSWPLLTWMQRKMCSIFTLQFGLDGSNDLVHFSFGVDIAIAVLAETNGRNFFWGSVCVCVYEHTNNGRPF